MFSSRFMLLPTSTHFFCLEIFFLISFRVLCYFQHYPKKIEILKSAPSLTG